MNMVIIEYIRVYYGVILQRIRRTSPIWDQMARFIFTLKGGMNERQLIIFIWSLILVKLSVKANHIFCKNISASIWCFSFEAKKMGVTADIVPVMLKLVLFCYLESPLRWIRSMRTGGEWCNKETHFLLLEMPEIIKSIPSISTSVPFLLK